MSAVPRLLESKDMDTSIPNLLNDCLQSAWPGYPCQVINSFVAILQGQDIT